MKALDALLELLEQAGAHPYISVWATLVFEYQDGTYEVRLEDWTPYNHEEAEKMPRFTIDGHVFTPMRVTLTFSNGTRPLRDAWQTTSAPGLAVTRDDRGLAWQVIHISSGLYIVIVGTRKRAAQALLHIGQVVPEIDWTQTEKAIQTLDDEVKARLVEAVLEAGKWA